MKKDENNIQIDDRLVIEQPKPIEKAQPDPEPAPKETPEEPRTLKEVIEQQATEEEVPQSSNLTLRQILGGDLLLKHFIRDQIWVIMLITLFTIIYISNRYSCQQDLIEIDQLQKDLQNAKYKTLSVSSELTEKCRESHVLELLRNNEDSVLKIPNQPPYIINIPE
ncbi:MAG: hypothetical protein IJS97_03645 [Prevotella sp.]|nr:hypothetical protein [Prevotella sp.]